MFGPWVGKIPWRMEWQPTPVVLPGEFHGQRSLVGYSPVGSQRVGHDWVANTFTFSFFCYCCSSFLPMMNNESHSYLWRSPFGSGTALGTVRTWKWMTKTWLLDARRLQVTGKIKHICKCIMILLWVWSINDDCEMRISCLDNHLWEIIVEVIEIVICFSFDCFQCSINVQCFIICFTLIWLWWILQNISFERWQET